MKTKENKVVEEKLTPMEDKTIHRQRKNTKLCCLDFLLSAVFPHLPHSIPGRL